MITVLILVAGGLAGWRQQVRHERVLEVHREVLAEAEALGVSTADGSDGGPARAGKLGTREREEQDAEARAFAARLIGFSKEMNEIQRQRKTPDAEFQKRVLEIMSGLLDLDAGQLKVLVEELRRSPDLDDQARSEITGLAVMMMAQDHPQQALAMFTESSDLLDLEGMGQHVIAAAVGRWAADDPMAALEWIRKNGEAHPELVNDRTKASVIQGAARQDPKLAIALIQELGVSERNANHLVDGVVTVEQRDRLLAALREQDDEELHLEAVSSMTSRVVADGFDQAQAWLSKAELSEEETQAVVMGLNHWQTRDDTGQWIEWVGERAEGPEADGRIRSLMQQWTSADYQAAGEWLAAAEDGAAKRSAVRGYVQAVTPYDPDAAAQWVATLPEGGERQEVARQVFSQWKGKDEAAARAFAEAEGLEVE